RRERDALVDAIDAVAFVDEQAADVNEALHARLERRFGGDTSAVDRNLPALLRLPVRTDRAVDHGVATLHHAVHIVGRHDVAEQDLEGPAGETCRALRLADDRYCIPPVSVAKQLDGPAAKESAGAGDEDALAAADGDGRDEIVTRFAKRRSFRVGIFD